MLLFVSVITKQLNRYLFTNVDSMVNKETGTVEDPGGQCIFRKR